ncbi:MAG: hypothetical protein O2849_06345, partial [Proteobacteria bacterium]|nr:hypothetical protein [Pseudomonadota bacterium]
NTTFTTSDFTGPTGATGPQGPQGPTGNDGSDGVSTVGSISSVGNSNGVSISGSTLTLSAATSTTGGVVTSGNQTIGGIKTFNDYLIIDGNVRIGIGDSSGSENINISGNSNMLDGTGSNNIVIGSNSGMDNTTGHDNSVLGANNLRYNTTGHENVAIGNLAMHENRTGENNVAVGYNSLRNNLGSNNTAIGHNASSGTALQTSIQTTVIGSNAGVNVGNIENSTAIGYNAVVDQDNTVVIGNNDVIKVYMSQDGGATVYANDLNLNGTAVTATAAELNYVDGVTSNIQTQLDSKLSSLTAGDGITISGSQISTDVKVAKFNWSNNYFNLSNSTENYIPWDTTVFNSNSSVYQLTNSGSTGTDCARILINETGYYELKALVFLYDMYSNVDVTVSVAKSTGSTGAMSLIELIFDGKFSESTSDRTLNSSTILSLSAGEYISISVNPSANGPYPASSSIGKTTLTLTKL